jgi:hypothetical protein
MASVMNDPQAGPIEVGKAADAISESIGKNPKASEVLALILFPIFSQAGSAEVRCQSDERSSRALLRALEIEARTGHYPTSIKQIPGTWIDPFNGKPLHLKLTGKGIRIYGVGPDLVDHGGVDRRELPKDSDTTKGYDVVALYPPFRAKSNR